MRSPGFEPGITSLEGLTSRLDWRTNEPEFLEYLGSKHYNKHYRKAILSNLKRHVSVIGEPMDIVRVSSTLTEGTRHNFSRAVSALLKFYELKGVNPNYLNALRRALPEDGCGIDLNIPSESEIIESLRKLSSIPIKYQAFYNLALDSGLRLTEAARLINEFENATEVKGFYRCTLGYFRGCKLAYAGYFTSYTLGLIQQVKKAQEKVDDRCASHYFYKYGFVRGKYLRKFSFDLWISERFNFPESLADFVQGRTPKKVGVRHYSNLLRLADGRYGLYAAYLAKLREKVKA